VTLVPCDSADAGARTIKQTTLAISNNHLGLILRLLLSPCYTTQPRSLNNTF
jgi:hypothetical protein